MAKLDLIPVIDEGLGNSTYILDLGDGRALVLDPERDVREVRAVARQHHLSIGYAVETHLHADFISGVRELAETEGAVILAPEVGPRGFTVTGLTDGEVISVGDVSLQAMATPGHSPEHLSYLLSDGGRIAGVFTGGSLMVGTAGRTDLVSPDRTVALAHDQYHSLQRLMELPDATPVWPTHGAGSFCSAAVGTERVTTIGKERRTNPLLQVSGEDEFVTVLLSSLGTFPDYFLRLGEINRYGPAVLANTPLLPALSAGRVKDLMGQGAQVVDVRAAADFAAGHIPGSLSDTLRPAFATWLGWLADPSKPLIIVRNRDQNPDDVLWAAAKVGFDTFAGELEGGFESWPRGDERATAPLLPGDCITGWQAPATVLDVRQGGEYASGHTPGALNIELGAFAARLAEVPVGPVVVMCSHGERAMSAASILTGAGRDDITVLDGGPDDWEHATGGSLEIVR